MAALKQIWKLIAVFEIIVSLADPTENINSNKNV
jgi:hypothetical protein